MPKIFVVVLCCLALAVQPLIAAPQPDKVAEVAAGKLKEAKASWWGFNAEDSTEFLQAAINSKAPKLIVDKQASAWITGPLFLVDNQEIVFEEDVELLAKAGLFHGRGDSLLSAPNTKNLKLAGLGKGAILRMRKADYHAEPYTKSEWRHGISLRGVENVTIENLSIVSSGGDGIYIASGRANCSRNVTIRKVVCDDNNRQGISVISADKLLIEDCVLKNTWGTSPQAGIDFEPNNSREQLTDCVMRRCAFENNAGDGIEFYLKYLVGSPIPISVRIEDCIVQGNKRYGLRYILGDSPVAQIKGSCELVNCRFENCEAGGILIEAKDAEASTLSLKGTTITNCGKGEKAPPILLRTGDSLESGGIDFGVVRLTDSFDRRPFELGDLVGHPKNVRGTLHLRRGDKTETVEINDAWFAKEYPNVIRRIPWEEPAPERFVPSEKADINVDTQFPPVWQRKQGDYWIYAEKGTPIRLALSVRQVGRNEIGRCTGVLTLPDGKTNRFNIPADKVRDFEFVLAAAPETGVYRLSAEVGSHAVQMLRCNQTVVIPAVPRLDLIYTTGTLYLHVPSGTKEFGVRVRGEPGEAIKASVVDPSGKTVWTEDVIVGAVQFDRTAQEGKIDGLWQIVLERPSRLGFEDNNVMILGVAPLLGLNPKQLLVPRSP